LDEFVVVVVVVGGGEVAVVGSSCIRSRMMIGCLVGVVFIVWVGFLVPPIKCGNVMIVRGLIGT
jgi:3-oxoacyl-ACP reductase-like protein